MVRFLGLLLALLFTLTTCGKKGPLLPPEGEVYPKIYPLFERRH